MRAANSTATGATTRDDRGIAMIAVDGGSVLAATLTDALHAWCGRPGVAMVDAAIGAGDAERHFEVGAVSDSRLDPAQVVATLFRQEGRSLVRLARLFVDDRNAAEDLVQEAFIRLARSTHRIQHADRAPAYLRSIVLNLARDENRRGLVSMRHRLPLRDAEAGADDEVLLHEDQQAVLDALRHLPARQRTCLVLRYYDELVPDAIATTLGISRNSVKTHLRHGLAALETELAAGRGLLERT